MTLARELSNLGHNVIISEDQKKIAVSPFYNCVENCVVAVKEHTDIVVLIISRRYGSTTNNGHSITTEEFLEAKKCNVPILLFVGESTLKLLPLYEKNSGTDFKPLVEDNRVFEFIKLASNDGDNWIFSFNEVLDIIETFKYQSSSLFREMLAKERHTSNELIYKHVNSHIIRLNNDGLCSRSLEYSLKNESQRPINSIICADRSDIPMPFKNKKLRISDEFGRELKYKVLLNEPTYQRFEIVFNKPLKFNEELIIYVFNYSYDLNNLYTSHTRKVKRGFIRYTFPIEVFKDKIIETELLTDNGWIIPKEVSINESTESIEVFYPYRNVKGAFQFKITW